MGEYNQSINQPSLFEELCNLNVLRTAFKSVEKSRGAPAVDGVTVEHFRNHSNEELSIIQQELITWTYKPNFVRSIDIKSTRACSKFEVG